MWPYFVGGSRHFYFKRPIGSSHYVLYRAYSWEDDNHDEVVLDPNTWSADFVENYRISHVWISNDGTYLAYAVSAFASPSTPIHPESELYQVKVRNLLTARDEPISLECYPESGIAWTSSNEGFFYVSWTNDPFVKETLARNKSPRSSPSKTSRREDSDSTIAGFYTVFYRRLQSPHHRNADVIVYATPENPSHFHSCTISSDQRYLIIGTTESRHDHVNTISYIDVSAFNGRDRSSLGDTKSIVSEFRGEYVYVTNVDRVFWFRTNENAPRYKIVKLQSEVDPDESVSDEMSEERCDFDHEEEGEYGLYSYQPKKGRRWSDFFSYFKSTKL